MSRGSCLCKKVEIETTGESLKTVACSCTSCQSCSSSIFSIEQVFPPGTLTVVQGQEHIKTFKETGDSGKPILRQFCDTCGNALWSEMVDGTLIVKAAVIPGALDIEPDKHIFAKNLPIWADGVKTGERRMAYP